PPGQGLRQATMRARAASGAAAPARATSGCAPSWFRQRRRPRIPGTPRSPRATGASLPAARYRRIAARRGHKKAVVALAHALLAILYHVIARRQPYHELGEDYFHRRDPDVRAKRLVHQLTHLGFEVQLHAQHAPAPTGGASTFAGGS